MSPNLRSRPLEHDKTLSSVPLIDPAAVSWHDWATKQTLHESVKREPTTSSKIVPRKPKTPTMAPEQDGCIKKNSTQWKTSIKNGCFPDLSVCFCHKSPSRSESAEFGIILECHYMNPAAYPPHNDNDPQTKPTKTRRHVCGFHVHQRTWDHFGTAFEKSRILDPMDPELNICPAFNFTFCVLIQCNNPYPKRTPSAPKCFCNLRVCQREPSGRTKKISFTCPNFDVDGARPKCSWFLWAEEVPFTKPKHPLHAPTMGHPTLVDTEHDLSAPTVTKKHMPQQSRGDTESQMDGPSSGHSVSGESCHETSNSDRTETEISSPHTETEQTLASKNETLIYHPELVRLLSANNVSDYNDANLNGPQTPRSPSSSNGYTNDEDRARYIPLETITVNSNLAARSNGHIIPSSVQKKYLIHSTPRSTPEVIREQNLTMQSGDIIPNPDVFKELENDKDRLNRTSNQLKFNLLVLQKSLDNMTKKNKEKESTLKTLETEKNKLESEIKLLGHEKEHLQEMQSRLEAILEEETNLRRNSQRRVANLEIMVGDLIRDNETLTEENDQNKEKLALKDMKCRVCFHHNIEFALVPCFHCAYCEECAEKLLECAVCRTLKFGVQKIYLG